MWSFACLARFARRTKKKRDCSQSIPELLPGFPSQFFFGYVHTRDRAFITSRGGGGGVWGGTVLKKAWFWGVNFGLAFYVKVVKLCYDWSKSTFPLKIKVLIHHTFLNETPALPWDVINVRPPIPNSFSCRHGKLSGIVWTVTVQIWKKSFTYIEHHVGWPRGVNELNRSLHSWIFTFPQWILVLASTYSLPFPVRLPVHTAPKWGTKPIWYVTLHVRDWRGADSLRCRKRAEITVLMCEPGMVFVPAQELFCMMRT